MRISRKLTSGILALALASAAPGSALPQDYAPDKAPSGPATATPIQHVVIIFQENVSFDHYFATYPNAKGGDGTAFNADPSTPSVNGLTHALLTANPNFNGTIGNPFRLSPSEAATCDQDHNYGDEQSMFDMGIMDNFVKFNSATCTPVGGFTGDLKAGHPNDLIMGYYDGNTVTALWNYAQNFAMNDNSFDTMFGPSAPGAVNLISGYTAMATQTSGNGDVTSGSLTNDAQPFGDACTTRDSASLAGKNIGDLLNAAGLTWGWFEGGFDLTIKNPNSSTGCARTHTSATGAFPPKVDYIAHHEPFQFYASTANPTHALPTGAIGTTDAANHQYDSHVFFTELQKGNLPDVVFLKAPGYQDGHAGYSSPIDEQTFIVDIINDLELSKLWDSTAVIVLYDDSDGWYDHQMSPIIIHSQADGTAGAGGQPDNLTGPNLCGSSSTGLQAQGRCGYGPRQPFMVISPWAKRNFVDHTTTDLTSGIAFIEQNWGLPSVMPASGNDPGSFDQYAGPITNMFDFSQKKGAVKSHVVYLDPSTGAVVKKKPKFVEP